MNEIYVNGQLTTVEKANNTKQIVEFYGHYELDPQESQLQGKNVYKNVDYALICSANGKRKTPKKVTEALIKQYPREWEYYKSGFMRTHLSLLGLKPNKIQDLEEYYNILSVEDLAKYPDDIFEYHSYQKVSKSIINLREKNHDEEEKQVTSENRSQTVRNSGKIQTGRQELRTAQIHKDQISSSFGGFSYEIVL